MDREGDPISFPRRSQRDIISYLNLTRDDCEAEDGNNQAFVERAGDPAKGGPRCTGWEPGTQFAVEEVADGVLLRTLRRFPLTKFEEVFGCLKYRKRAKTLRQMEEAIAKTVRERHGRGRY